MSVRDVAQFVRLMEVFEDGGMLHPLSRSDDGILMMSWSRSFEPAFYGTAFEVLFDERKRRLAVPPDFQVMPTVAGGLIFNQAFDSVLLFKEKNCWDLVRRTVGTDGNPLALVKHEVRAKTGVRETELDTRFNEVACHQIGVKDGRSVKTTRVFVATGCEWDLEGVEQCQ